MSAQDQRYVDWVYDSLKFYGDEKWTPSTWSLLITRLGINGIDQESLALQKQTPLIAPIVLKSFDQCWVSAAAEKFRRTQTEPDPPSFSRSDLNKWPTYTDDDWRKMFPPRTKADIAIRRTRIHDALLFADRKGVHVPTILWHCRWLDYITVMNLLYATAIHGNDFLDPFVQAGALFSVDAFSDFSKTLNQASKTRPGDIAFRQRYAETGGLVGYRNLPFPGFDRKAEAAKWAAGGKPHGLVGDDWARRFRGAAQTITQSAVPKTVPWMSLFDWISSDKWVTAGSSSEGRVDWTDGTEHGKFKARKNFLHDIYTDQQLYEIAVKSMGKQVNTSITKNQLGKVRLVVASDLGNYLVDSWLDYLCGSVYERWPGSTLNEDFRRMHTRLLSTLKNLFERYGLPFDYAEFDRQVQAWEMSVLTEEYFKCGEQNVPLDQRPFWRMATAASAASYFNSVLVDTDNGDTTEYRVTGGLPSGLRLTTVMGNLWNMVMTSIVRNIMLELGVPASYYTFDLRGDDSSITAATYWQALCFRMGYQAVNAIGHDQKFSVLYESVEFLRVWFQDNRTFGWPNRSIPALSQRKPWSDEPWTPESQISAVAAAPQTIVRRLDLQPDYFYPLLRDIWTKQRRLSTAWLSLPRQFGGLGIFPWDGKFPSRGLPKIRPPDVTITNANPQRLKYYLTTYADFTPDLPTMIKLWREDMASKLGADDIRGISHLLRTRYQEDLDGLRVKWENVPRQNDMRMVRVTGFEALKLSNIRPDDVLLPALQETTDPEFGRWRKMTLEVDRAKRILRITKEMSLRAWIRLRNPQMFSSLEYLTRHGVHMTMALDYMFGVLPPVDSTTLHPLLNRCLVSTWTTLFSNALSHIPAVRQRDFLRWLMGRYFPVCADSLAASPCARTLYNW